MQIYESECRLNYNERLKIEKYLIKTEVRRMQQRRLQLLKMLIERKRKYSQTNELADRLECSPRTLRNDLNQLTDSLEKNEYGTIERVRGVGVRIQTPPNKEKELEKWLWKLEHHSPKQETKERQLFILYQLLMAKKPLTLESFANQYYVSQPIIRKDLDELASVGKPYSVTIHTVKRAGTTVEGSESNKRALLSYTVKQLSKLSSQDKTLLQIFNAVEINVVTEALNAVERIYSIEFASEASDGLKLHALFTIKRLYLNKPVELSDEKKDSILHTPYYEWASEFAIQVEDKLSIRFPMNEVSYLALHFQNARLNKMNQDNVKEAGHRPEWVDLLVRYLINEVSDLTGLPLAKGEILRENLILHLETTASRLENEFIIANPLLNEIKKEYVYLFHFVQSTVENYFEGQSFSLPEEEMGYLTVHFQAAIERSKGKKPQNLKVGIVCHHGIGVSAFIQARIESRFPSINEIVLLAENEVDAAIRSHSLSFILTTVPLQMDQSIPMLQISPLLNEDEVDEIAELLRLTGEQAASKETKAWSLLHYSQPFLIHLQKEYTELADVLTFMARELEKRGYVNENYVDSVLEREERASTAIGKGIALPHGLPAHIHSSVISCVTLAEPIKWGNEKVSVIFMFALKKEELKNKEAKSFFKFIQKVMDNSKKLNKLKEEQDVLKFLDYTSFE